jgi:hypothetical protein
LIADGLGARKSEQLTRRIASLDNTIGDKRQPFGRLEQEGSLVVLELWVNSKREPGINLDFGTIPVR